MGMVAATPQAADGGDGSGGGGHMLGLAGAGGNNGSPGPAGLGKRVRWVTILSARRRHPACRAVLQALSLHSFETARLYPQHLPPVQPSLLLLQRQASCDLFAAQLVILVLHACPAACPADETRRVGLRPMPAGLRLPFAPPAEGPSRLHLLNLCWCCCCCCRSAHCHCHPTRGTPEVHEDVPNPDVVADAAGFGAGVPDNADKSASPTKKPLTLKGYIRPSRPTTTSGPRSALLLDGSVEGIRVGARPDNLWLIAASFAAADQSGPTKLGSLWVCSCLAGLSTST